MKYIYLFIFLFIINIQLFSQNVDVTDYEVPISTAQLLRLNGNWNWSQSGDSVTSNVANANLIFKKFYSSLPFAWFIDVDIMGRKNKNDGGHSIKISADGRKYIFEDKDLFTFAKINVEHYNYYDQIASSLVLGTGYGRYINATALAKAVRLEEHLLKEKIITGSLPRNTMVKIANIIERQSEYENLYSDVFETFWISDIEKEIKASGMLKGDNIGALGILRIRQVLFEINEIINDRYYGWDISVGARFDLSTSDKSKVGAPKLNISGNYSYPIGWKMQINSRAEAFTPIDSNFFRKFELKFQSDFIYELGNRINFIATYKFGLQKEFFYDEIAQHEFNAAFLFYIENKIYLSLSANMMQAKNNPRTLSLSMSIQYNIL